jgi:hypothetical protein
VEVKVDGNQVAIVQGFVNEFNSHRALVPEFAVIEGLSAGKQVMEIPD